jgi:nucleotide-binding universal stress UspA family protein
MRCETTGGFVSQESVTLMTTNAPEPETMGNGGQARILVPLDGSELAAKALPVAEGLCQQLSAQLDLVSIVPPTVLPYIGGGPYIPGDVYTRIDTERAQEVEKYLASTAAKIRERGIHTQAHLGRGDPASGVLDTAQELGSMLIVMTTHGRTGLARFALGSVADRLVRGGVAPVLLMRSFHELAHDQGLSHALIPLDGSPVAEAPVFSLVPQLAGAVLRTITLLRVADLRDGEAGRQMCEDYLAAVRQRLVDRLDRLGDRDCAISVLVRDNKNPAASIVEASQDGECDLVLMATNGEAGIGRLAFGGVTDRVLRDGKTPLLLAHTGQK